MAVVWGRGAHAQAVVIAPESGPACNLQMGNLRQVATAQPSQLTVSPDEWKTREEEEEDERIESMR